MPAPLPPETHTRIPDLIADGVSYTEIARTLGISRTWIRRHYPGHAWTRTQTGRYARLTPRAAQETSPMSYDIVTRSVAHINAPIDGIPRLHPQTLTAARLTVCELAADATDAAELLTILGIHPAQEKTHS